MKWLRLQLCGLAWFVSSVTFDWAVRLDPEQRPPSRERAREALRAVLEMKRRREGNSRQWN